MPLRYEFLVRIEVIVVWAHGMENRGCFIDCGVCMENGSCFISCGVCMESGGCFIDCVVNLSN